VRELYKEGACAISLADELVVKNVNETQAIAIGQESIRVFQPILEAGVFPAELHASPLNGIGDEKPL
jgi:hypothetical protein